MKYYVKNQLSGINQISYFFKAYFVVENKYIPIPKEYSTEVMNWFNEYTYLVRDKYNLKNFKASDVKFHHDTFKAVFDVPSTYSLFEAGEIVEMLLNPDIEGEFPIVIKGNPHYVVGEIPEF
jgi:hypothetical protein